MPPKGKKRKASVKKGGDEKGTDKKKTPPTKPERPFRTAAECQKMLWQSLPLVRAYLTSHPAPSEDVIALAAKGDEEAALKVSSYQAPDELVIPWDQMKSLVECCIRSTHGNCTDEDVEERIETEIGTSDAPTQVTFGKADVLSFVESIPAKWMPHFAVPKGNGPSRREALRFFLQELTENIINDEPPNELLEPSQVLMMVAVAGKPTMLSNPVDTFITLPPPKLYPAVVDTLWDLVNDGKPNQRTTSLSAFRVFFSWFYLLHYEEITIARAEAAAHSTYFHWLNQKGEMVKEGFQRAFTEMCLQMARQRDAVPYITRCVELTAAAHAEKGAVCPGLLFFQGVSVGAIPRRVEYDPGQFYISEEIRQWRQNEEIHGETLSRNRILVHGQRWVGKSRVGRALANHLKCLHLDVFELAREAMQHDTTLGIEVKRRIEEDQPVPLELQARLVREALTSQKSEYRGYVFSDTLLYTTKDADAITKYLEGVGVLSESLPTVYLEVTSEASVLAEVAARSQAEEEDLFRTESRRRSAEKKLLAEIQQLDEEVQELEARHAEVSERMEALEVPEDAAEETEEMEAFRTSLDSIQESLNTHNHELAKKRAIRAEDEEGEPAEVEQRHRERDDIYLRYLISCGRRDLLQSPENHQRLTELTAIKRLIDTAKAAHHNQVFSVDGSSSDATICTYVMHAANLHVPLLPVEPEVEGTFPESVDGDQARGRAKEAAAQAVNAEPSHTWKRYCPVTYAEEVLLIPGAPCYSCIFEGRVYYMASSTKMEQFMSNPHRYLSNEPLDRHQIFLIADPSVLKATDINLTSLADEMAAKFLLHRMSFTQYHDSLMDRRQQQQRREEVYNRRVEYEKEERDLRDERLAKRLIAELKNKKKTPQKPKVKGKKGAAADVEAAAEPVKEEEEEQETPALPERLEDEIQQMIVSAKLERRNAVPVLLELLNGTVDLKAIELLMNEGVLPENVVVLQKILPEGHKEEESEEAGKEGAAASTTGEVEGASLSGAPHVNPPGETDAEPAAEEPTEEAASPVTEEQQPQDEEEEEVVANTIEACLEELATPRKEWKMAPGVVPTVHNISRINVFGRTEAEILQELNILLNPGAAPVEQGVVDEELGADADEEEEDEEDDDEDEDESNPQPPLEKIEKELRPVKRFLHQFGSRLQFCPVSLIERGLLVRGRNEFCSKYYDELYCFASDTYKAKFDANPLLYIGELPPSSVPPRFWMVGVEQPGKKQLAAALSEAYDIPYFEYSRKFLEECIEAAQSESGSLVNGVFIPPQGPENQYLKRGGAMLKELRDFEAEQTKKMQQREEAETIMAQREEREDLEEEEEEAVDEELEERLREWSEFEPEDEEDKLVRLNEAYLRIAGCVTRLEPFEKKGYIMLFAPIAEADLDFVFDEGGVPELVIDVVVTPEVLLARTKPNVEAEEDSAAAPAPAAASGPTDKEWELLCRRKERMLKRWRRRHIGANDPPSDDEGKNEEEDDEAGAGANEEGRGDGDDNNEELMDEFMEGLEDRRVKVMKVRNDLEPGASLSSAKVRLASHLENRLSFFCAPQVVFYDNALKLLESGRARISVFGYEDPVSLLEHTNGHRRINHWKANGLAMMPELEEDEESNNDAEKDEEAAMQDADNDEEMSELGSDDLEEMRERLQRRRNKVWRRTAPRSVILYHRIYFFQNNVTLKRFLDSPLKYIQQPPPLPPLREAPVISIFEDDVFFVDESDGEKKRSIAETIAMNLNSEFISIPKLLSWAGLHTMLGELSMTAIQAALNGNVTDDLIQRLLIARLSSADVKEKGAVLLNLPRTTEQHAALLSSSGTSPIVQVAKIALSGVRGRRSQLNSWATPVIEALLENATVNLPVAVEGNPKSNANLNEMVRHVDEFVDNERSKIVRSRRAFPIDMENTYQTWTTIRENLSEYQWYCPYCWVNHSDLVYVQNREPRLAATYLDKYYFFSHVSFLQKFLKNPTEVSDPSRLRPLPPHLPQPTNDDIPFEQLELQGCCPVVLYDTRENKGLQGVLEPRATLGSRNFVVTYAGKYYALLNRENRTRFLMCPWVFVDSCFMPPPRKCPLTAAEVKDGITDEYFIRRQLYDAVAYAMLAVTTLRPQYPGLSIEESALKYMALHMKAHNEANTQIQMNQYTRNLKTYEDRATLYREFVKVEVEKEEDRTKVDQLCEVYDRMLMVENRLDKLSRLRTTENHDPSFVHSVVSRSSTAQP